MVAPQSLVIPTISAPDFSLITSYLSGTKSFGVVILSQIVLVRKESFFLVIGIYSFFQVTECKIITL